MLRFPGHISRYSGARSKMVALSYLKSNCLLGNGASIIFIRTGIFGAAVAEGQALCQQKQVQSTISHRDPKESTSNIFCNASPQHPWSPTAVTDNRPREANLSRQSSWNRESRRWVVQPAICLEALNILLPQNWHITTRLFLGQELVLSS